MKSFTVVKVHMVLFEHGPRFLGTSFQINEIVDEQGQTHFSHGNIGHVADMVYCAGVTIRILQKAHNLFEAKASLVELIIEHQIALLELEFSGKFFEELFKVFGWAKKRKTSKPKESIDFKPLMRELGDLPLLIGFFKGETTKKIFEEVLKNG